MKKIGIVTIYQNSDNYGGNLQAYALVEVLKKQGYEAEQLSFSHREKSLGVSRSLKQKVIDSLKVGLGEFFNLTNKYFKSKISRIKNCKYIQNNELRKNSIKRFNNMIAHSEQVFYPNELNIDNMPNYDVVITGSDQVWNTEWYRKEYFLNFVPSNVKKIAYSASIGVNDFKEELKSEIKEYLKDFKAISVREQNAVKVLDNLGIFNSIVVLDPTLLLSANDWDKVCSKRIEQNNYVFCYFLGENAQERKLAEQYAKEKKLKLKILDLNPIKLKRYEKYKVWQVGVEEFLSYIKYAECVFTDSFHAVVFSNIFKKQYFVFNRNKKCEMNSRIYNITELFNQKERYCDITSKENLQYLLSQKAIDYTIKNDKFENLKEFSVNFLKNNIENE